MFITLFTKKNIITRIEDNPTFLKQFRIIRLTELMLTELSQNDVLTCEVANPTSRAYSGGGSRNAFWNTGKKKYLRLVKNAKPQNPNSA